MFTADIILAGAVAGQVYRSSPYRLGHSFSLGAVVLAQFLIVIKALYIRNENRKKQRIADGEIPDTRKVRDGDRELDFKYHI